MRRGRGVIDCSSCLTGIQGQHGLKVLIFKVSMRLICNFAFTDRENLPMPVQSVILLVFALCMAHPLRAHEFWLTPVTVPLVAGDNARLTLQVGEYFEGELIGFSAPQTLDLRRYSASGNVDLRALLPQNISAAALLVPLPAPGIHMVIFNSHPSTISLSADTFHAYLHDEGLDFIKAQREAAGIAGTPGRERYRRFVKTLIRVAPKSSAVSSQAIKSDITHSTLTGQRLEILPINNPMAMLPGDVLGVRVVFDGKPLKGALLKAWHRRGSQTLIIRATTAADGSAAFDLPYAGPWMISVVHMVPVLDVKDIDWDSLWSNLSFNLVGKR